MKSSAGAKIRPVVKSKLLKIYRHCSQMEPSAEVTAIKLSLALQS